MKHLKFAFLLLLWAAILSTGAFAVYGPQDLTIPDRAEAIVYGQSGAALSAARSSSERWSTTWFPLIFLLNLKPRRCGLG